MGKQKKIWNEEKSKYYGGVRKPSSTRKGQVFQDKTKYNRKEKHKEELE